MVSFSNLTDMLTGPGCAHAEGCAIDSYTDPFSIALFYMRQSQLYGKGADGAQGVGSEGWKSGGAGRVCCQEMALDR